MDKTSKAEEREQGPWGCGVERDLTSKDRELENGQFWRNCPFASAKKWHFGRPDLKTESNNLAKHSPKWLGRHLGHAFPFSGEYQVIFEKSHTFHRFGGVLPTSSGPTGTHFIWYPFLQTYLNVDFFNLNFFNLNFFNLDFFNLNFFYLENLILKNFIWEI